MDERQWKEAGSIIKRRRLWLELGQEAAAAKTEGRVSTANWRVIESGVAKNYHEPTLRGVAAALGWPPNWPAMVERGDGENLVTGTMLIDRPGVSLFGNPEDQRPDPRLDAVATLIEQGCASMEEALAAFREVLNQLRADPPPETR